MTEILSQDEIDALLTAVSSGESIPTEPAHTGGGGGGGGGRGSVSGPKRERKG